MYGSEYRAVPDDHDEVRRRAVDELVEMGLIDADAVESTHVTFVPQGNPISTWGGATRCVISAYVERMGVELAGRYAEWKYLMTDACVISARRAAKRLQGWATRSTTREPASAVRAEPGVAGEAPHHLEVLRTGHVDVAGSPATITTVPPRAATSSVSSTRQAPRRAPRAAPAHGRRAASG